jgi:hypothetical protein
MVSQSPLVVGMLLGVGFIAIPHQYSGCLPLGTTSLPPQMQGTWLHTVPRLGVGDHSSPSVHGYYSPAGKLAGTRAASTRSRWKH